MAATCPIKCVVPGRIRIILGYKDYYFVNKKVLCTSAFSSAAVLSTIDDGATPPGSTELNNEMGQNCKLMKEQHCSFC
jgi:hypothetical protein